MSNTKKLLSGLIVFSCLLLVINFGLRSSMGFFLTPISEEFGYGREVFAFSLALQNLCWGLFQPVAGAFSDKFGTFKTLVLGSLVYAAGLYFTSVAESAFDLHIAAGMLIGMGVAGTGLGVVLPAMARMVSADKRAMVLGLGTAAGSAGQFLVIPAAQELISSFGWQFTMLLLAIGALAMVALAIPFSKDKGGPKSTTTGDDLGFRDAIVEATTNVHYWLLIAGFFVCGFQLAFISVHMPSYLADKGFDSQVAVICLALIGLFNIFGCLLFGSWSGKYSKKNLLGLIYLFRAIAIAAFMIYPLSLTSVYLFAIVTGFLWLATVPATSGIVAQMFGLKYMGTLFGIVFLNHQLGSFVGVWLGGYLYDETGSYDIVWWSAAVIALVTAILHIFIDERPVSRIRTAAAAA
ncbi:MAG: MFS transporter [Pseudomonadales bacterium]|nr:MFS transporter [Pseudomonadales bacterium]NRA13901.1 MFS transporter [Oceanospirillaceae bacterium]